MKKEAEDGTFLIKKDQGETDSSLCAKVIRIE